MYSKLRTITYICTHKKRSMLSFGCSCKYTNVSQKDNFTRGQEKEVHGMQSRL